VKSSKRSLFYKKAPQKIFAPAGENARRPRSKKVFWFFFSKKNFLLLMLLKPIAF